MCINVIELTRLTPEMMIHEQLQYSRCVIRLRLNSHCHVINNNNVPSPSSFSTPCLSQCFQKTPTKRTFLNSDKMSLALRLEAHCRALAPTKRDHVALTIMPPLHPSMGVAPVSARRYWWGDGGTARSNHV